MNGLATLQHEFQSYLLDESDDIGAAVENGPRANRQQLMSIYRHAYFMRLYECLAVDYPGLRAMLGEADFVALVRDYLRAHPSRGPNVRWLGRALPGYVATHRIGVAAPAAAEMAAFEWALGLASDAADDDPLLFEELTALSGEAWAALQFAPRANVRRLTFSWQVPQAWQQREDCTETGLDVAAAERRTGWLVWRSGTDVLFRSLADDEAWAFDAAAQGATFADLCEGLCRHLPAAQAPERAAGLLRIWIDDGLLRRRTSSD